MHKGANHNHKVPTRNQFKIVMVQLINFFFYKKQKILFIKKRYKFIVQLFLVLPDRKVGSVQGWNAFNIQEIGLCCRQWKLYVGWITYYFPCLSTHTHTPISWWKNSSKPTVVGVKMFFIYTKFRKKLFKQTKYG